MSLSLETIQDGFYTWVKQVLPSRTVIFLNPNAPRPERPYITLDVSSFAGIGRDFEQQPDENGDSFVFGERQVTLELNVYGATGFDDIAKLATSLMQSNITALLSNYGLVFIRWETSEDITELLDTKYEKRYLAELIFNTSSLGIEDPDKFNVGYVERVAGQVKKQDFDTGNS